MSEQVNVKGRKKKPPDYYRRVDLKRFYTSIVALLFAMACTVPVMAEDDGVIKLTLDENRWIALHYLLQAQGSYQEQYDEYSETGSTYLEGDKKYYGSDGKIRRSRVILKGQVSEKISFFMETDAPNQEGYDSGSLFTQDAYVDIAFMDEFKIAAGHILLPFMHHNRASAVSLLGVDYNVKTVPVGGNVWRDAGIEVRGLLFDGLIDYRAGAFNGQDNEWVNVDGSNYSENDTELNEKDNLRYTGRVQVNFMDAESAFFYSDNYLGKKKVLSIGGGVDYQKDVYAKDVEKTDDYMAWTVDLTVDVPVGNGHAFALQGAYTSFKNSPRFDENPDWMSVIPQFSGMMVFPRYGNKATQTYESTMYFVQAGFLWNNMLQPVVKYWTTETKEAKGDDELKTTMLTGGLNYFINGHNANIKIEYNYPIEDQGHTIDRGVVVQAQIFI